jgi:hypothetical protein
VSKNINILYSGPDFFLQADYPTQVATQSVVCWNLSLTNIENVSASNTWIASQGNTPVTITSLKDLSNNTVITPVGGIYQLGTIAAASTKNYQLCATYTGCTIDSLQLVQSWNCNGYPASVNANTCTSPTKMTLKVVPQQPLVITNVTSPATTVNLCDTSTFIIEGVNIQMGNAYNLDLTALLPPGVSIVLGTSKIAYPANSAFTALADPVNNTWNISALNASIGANGLQGILTPTLNTVRIKFQVTTDCSYISGSTASFHYNAESFCGSPTGQLVTLSSKLNITGATPQYFATSTIKKNY